MTLTKKKDVAKWVNYELDRLGLSARCPKTGKSALLVAIWDRNSPQSRGRFQFVTKINERRNNYNCTSGDVPYLELMAYDGTRDIGINWHDRVNQGKNDVRGHLSG